MSIHSMLSCCFPSIPSISFNDFSYTAMDTSEKVETVCICPCTSALVDGVPANLEITNTLDSKVNVHEVDEDDDDTEDGVIDLEQVNTGNVQEESKITENDEFVYLDDSFCSGESSDESQDSEGSKSSLGGPDSSLLDADDKSEEKEAAKSSNNNENNEEDNTDDNATICSLENDTTHPTSEGKSITFRQSRSRRKNMTFTDAELRKIERENELLLRKIMAQQKPRDKVFKEDVTCSRTSSSAINRKKLQKKIEGDNILLLRKIQQAKPCVMTSTTKPGCRLTFL